MTRSPMPLEQLNGPVRGIGCSALFGLFSERVRKTIRDRLTLNWAGGYEYAVCEAAIIERTTFPSCMTWDGKRAHFQDAAPPTYSLIAGKSMDIRKDFHRGRKVSFWGKIRGAITPPRMLGDYSLPNNKVTDAAKPRSV